MKDALLLGLVVVAILVHAQPSFSAVSDAREVARLNNCIPKKIEVYRQKLGADSQTVYQVECNMPKAKDESSPQSASAMLVQCNGSLCEMLRRVAPASK